MGDHGHEGEELFGIFTSREALRAALPWAEWGDGGRPIRNTAAQRKAWGSCL